MPSDAALSNGNVEAQWGAFKTYLCEPYKNNPERLKELQLWYDELYARREKDGMELSQARITHDLTGRSLTAFCLNRQMYFSHDIAVLTLPYPRDPATGVKHDRLVGVYLHDFSVLDTSWQDAYRKGIEAIDTISAEKAMTKDGARFILTEHNDIIFGALKKRLREPDLAHEELNLTGMSQIRISKNDPKAGGPHHDVLIVGPDTPSPYNEPYWDRFVIHVLKGPGTRYFLGEDENKPVTVFAGATSAHFSAHLHAAAEWNWGVLHEASRDPEGRAILTPNAVNPLPVAGRTSRWNISHKNFG